MIKVYVTLNVGPGTMLSEGKWVCETESVDTSDYPPFLSVIVKAKEKVSAKTT